MGKKNIFSALTTDENSILGASLRSGMEKVGRLTGEHDLFMETAGLTKDLHDAWRARWDAEHPKK